MSAITKIFGAIISFFTGLLGIFSKKKKGEFYLEIDPSKDGAAAPQEVAAESSGGAAVASKPDEAPKSKKTSKAKKAPKSKKAPKAKKEKASQPAAPLPQAAPTPQPSAAALASQALNMPKPKVSTIEPLDIPKFGPRRRPGSNMQSFLDMAKTVKS